MSKKKILKVSNRYIQGSFRNLTTLISVSTVRSLIIILLILLGIIICISIGWMGKNWFIHSFTNTLPTDQQYLLQEGRITIQYTSSNSEKTYDAPKKIIKKCKITNPGPNRAILSQAYRELYLHLKPRAKLRLSTPPYPFLEQGTLQIIQKESAPFSQPWIIETHSAKLEGKGSVHIMVDEFIDYTHIESLHGTIYVYDLTALREFRLEEGEWCETGPGANRRGLFPNLDIEKSIMFLNGKVLMVRLLDASQDIELKPLSPIPDGLILNFQRLPSNNVKIVPQIEPPADEVEFLLINKENSIKYTARRRGEQASVDTWIDPNNSEIPFSKIPQGYYILQIIPKYRIREIDQQLSVSGQWIQLRLKIYPKKD